MNCKHEETKEIITAKEIEIKCSGCKEIVHTRKRVMSSNIYAIGRSGKKTEVQFMNKGGPGKVYISVKDVPKDIHASFMKSDSKGSFFATELKEEYEFVPVEGKE